MIEDKEFESKVELIKNRVKQHDLNVIKQKESQDE